MGPPTVPTPAAPHHHAPGQILLLPSEAPRRQPPRPRSCRALLPRFVPHSYCPKLAPALPCSCPFPAGEVATKNIVNMRHKMLDAVREALGKVKSGAYDHEEEEEEAQQEEAEEQPEASEEATEEEAPAAKKGKKEGKKESKKEGKKSKQAASEEDEEEEQAAEGGDDEKEEAKPEKGAVGASADALEDDFGELAAVIEPEEDKLVLSKKERLKKMDKARKDQRKAERRAELGGKGGGGSEDEKEAGGGGGWAEAEKGAGKQKGKKAKVVKF